MKRMHRVSGLLLAIIFLTVIFFSMLFISMEMGHHHCSREHCPICATMEECLNNLKSCGTAVIIMSVTAILLPYITKTVQKSSKEAKKCNLISYRVRLNY